MWSIPYSNFPRAVLVRRKRWLRLGVCITLIAILLDLFVSIATRTPKVPSPKVEGRIKEKLYIASLHWNDEVVLRARWISALLDLVRQCDDVYVSVYESGSWDNTKGALRELDEQLEALGVERNIVLSNRTRDDEVNQEVPEDEPGWIQTPSGKKQLRRIPFLAENRNRAMDDLQTLAKRTQNPRTFDKVLWLNDVIFSPSDIKNLLQTHDGDYAAACALDFSYPPKFYDSFAIRDSNGSPALSLIWPYFLSSDSRAAAVSNSPIPVKSCWNGLTIFDAAPFYRDENPLRFRGIPDSLAQKHLEGSECCLIHADNELSERHGVWLNPNVRVTYNERADWAVHPEGGRWPGIWVKVKGIWWNRILYLTGLWNRRSADRMVKGLVDEWMKQTGEKEVETSCLVDEMQVLVGNGWKHV